ncbi:MAG: BglG family transcription antiterminator [Streptococcaceae bacterium]|nr:BglG family transcription antiterminator [Streptococcaceae bacterium]MCH4176882.1 BglG family transcription antiterminator [Streptococcaceae bacterium]
MLPFKRLDDLFILLSKANSPLTVTELSKILSISSKTLRNDIRLINEVINQQNINIQLIRGKGYQFDSNSDQRTIKALSQEIIQQQAEHHDLDSQADRILYIFSLLLYANSPISFDTLMAKVGVSESTLYSYLKIMRKSLKPYHLKLSNRTNIGISIKGDEQSKREMISNYFIDKNFSDYVASYTQIEQKLFHDINLEKIAITFSKHFNQSEYPISDYNRKNILFHLALSISRIIHYHELNDFSYPSVKLANSLASKFQKMIIELENAFSLIFPSAECNYLSFHLLINGFNGPQESDNQEIILYNEKLLELIDKFFQYQFNLSTDQALKDDLFLHLRSIINLSQYGRTLKNPMLKSIKNDFSLSYDSVLTATIKLKEKFSFNLTPDDIGYLALHVESALIRKKANKYAKNKVILVCGSGRATSKLIEAELLFYLPEIDIIQKLSLAEYNQVLKHNLECDLIISTLPLKHPTIPVLHINFSSLNKDINQIKHRIETIEKKKYDLNSVLDEKYFITEKFYQDKFDLIKQLGNSLFNDQIVDSHFIEDVIQREKISETYLKNGIAIPHPLTNNAYHTKIAVAIPKEPIVWNGDGKKAQIIFLIAPAKSDQGQLDYFFEELMLLLENRQKKRQLIRSEDFPTFLKRIKS